MVLNPTHVCRDGRRNHEWEPRGTGGLGFGGEGEVNFHLLLNWTKTNPHVFRTKTTKCFIFWIFDVCKICFGPNS